MNAQQKKLYVLRKPMKSPDNKKLFPERINLHLGVINKLEMTYRYIANKKNLQFNIENNIGDHEIVADKDTLFSLLRYLLDSAIKYTYKGYISVILNNHEGKPAVDINFTGINIASNSSKVIFEMLLDKNEKLNKPENFDFSHVKSLCSKNMISFRHSNTDEKPCYFRLIFNN